MSNKKIQLKSTDGQDLLFPKTLVSNIVDDDDTNLTSILATKAALADVTNLQAKVGTGTLDSDFGVNANLISAVNILKTSLAEKASVTDLNLVKSEIGNLDFDDSFDSSIKTITDAINDLKISLNSSISQSELTTLKTQLGNLQLNNKFDSSVKNITDAVNDLKDDIESINTDDFTFTSTDHSIETKKNEDKNGKTVGLNLSVGYVNPYNVRFDINEFADGQFIQVVKYTDEKGNTYGVLKGLTDTDGKDVTIGDLVFSDLI